MAQILCSQCSTMLASRRWVTLGLSKGTALPRWYRSPRVPLGLSQRVHDAVLELAPVLEVLAHVWEVSAHVWKVLAHARIFFEGVLAVVVVERASLPPPAMRQGNGPEEDGDEDGDEDPGDGA